MVQQLTSSEHLNATFAALADPTRRAILARLASGETSVSELAEPFEMSMPAISKHLKVLQRAGLIERGREAQWRPCRLAAAPLKDASDWLDHYRRFWEEAFDRLEDYLRELKAGRAKKGEEKWPQEVTSPPSPSIANSSSRASSTRRASLYGKRSPIAIDLATLVGHERPHHASARARPAPGRHVSLRHADAGRPRDVRQMGLSRDSRARAAS